MRALLYLFILSLFIPELIYPQDYWEQTNGPFSGEIRDQVYSDGVLYVGTNHGVYSSVDNAESFRKFGLQGHLNVQSIAADDKYIYAGGFLSALFRRDKINDIIDWEPLNCSQAGHIYIIKIHPSGAVFLAGSEEKLFVSYDRGLTWEETGLSLPDEPFTSILITGNGTMYAGFRDAGLFKSTDEGKSWIQLSTGLPSQGEIQLMEDHNGYIYAGFTQSATGLYRSTDGGDTWSLVHQMFVTFLYKASGGWLFGGNNTVLYRSLNGTDWEWMGTGLQLYYFPISVSCNSSGDIFLGIYSGFYKSTNYGSSFQLIGLSIDNISAMTVAEDGKIYAGGSDYISYSTDKGLNWTRQMGLSTTKCLSLFRTADNSILAGLQNEGLYRSASGTNYWQKVLDAPSLVIRNLFQTPDRNVYAIDPSTLYKSVNDGINWEIVISAHIMQSKKCGAYYNGMLFVGTGGDGIYYSSDSAASWNQINTGLTNSYVNTFLSDGDVLLAGTGSGIYLLNRDRWVDISNEYTTNRKIYQLLLSRNNIYAATDGGVYVTGIEEFKWRPINTGLEDLTVLSLAADNNGILFAGTEYGSVYRYPAVSTALVEDFRGPGEFKLYQNYPNPFNPSTTIKYSVPEEIHVSLKIYDILGSVVSVLNDGSRQQGTYEVEFNGGTLASGVYFCTFKAGEFIETKKLLLMK